MPYCKVCRYEYAEGITRCPDCKVELVAELPPLEESGVEPGYVKVYVASDEMEARIIASTLEEAGIKTWDRSEYAQSQPTMSVGAVAPEDILVLNTDAQKAKEVIEQSLATGEKLDTMEESPE